MYATSKFGISVVKESSENIEIKKEKTKRKGGYCRVSESFVFVRVPMEVHPELKSVTIINFGSERFLTAPNVFRCSSLINSHEIYMKIKILQIY